jgi:tetratricopeptide (TPR) repeat protein
MNRSPFRPSKRRVLAACAAALALSALVVGPEQATAGVPCSASVEEARRHMDRGFELYDKRRFLEAAAEFDAAYAAQPFSACLCNAAMAYQEGLDFAHAIERYEAFLSAEPNPPDLPRIHAMLGWLKAQNEAQIRAHGDAGSPEPADAGGAPSVADAAAPAAADAGSVPLFDFADAGSHPPSDAGAPSSTDAGAPLSPPPPPVDIRSQVVIESDPPGAPVAIYERKKSAPPWVSAGPNPGWTKVVSGEKTPYDVALGAAEYHIVLEAFRDYKRSETSLQLAPGRVYAFKANLSQGTFLGFLRVTSPIEGAAIFVDDPPPHKKGPWGRAPHGEMLEAGQHRIWVEAPGFEPFTTKAAIEHGTSAEIVAGLARVGYGFVRVDGNVEEMTVKIDDVPYGTYASIGDPLKIRLPAGRHKVELDAGGHKAFTGDVEVPPGQEIAVHGRLALSPPRLNALASGALAVGAGVGAAALFRQPSYELRGFDFGGVPRYGPTGTQPWLKIGGGVAVGVSGLLVLATGYSLLHDPYPASRVQVDAPREFGSPAEPGAAPEKKKSAGVRLEGIVPEVCFTGGGLGIRGSF